MSKPRAIDLFCGLGGWTEGLLAAGYDVTGYDIEAHEYDGERYPARLVLQDVLTLDGAQFADADLIVASPPCTEYSYMAMPWSRAKQIARALRGEGEFPEGYKGSRTIADLNALFDACFRIQREASQAAGRKVPMVVENVRGTEPWVGRARWNFGSGSGRSFQSESVSRHVEEGRKHKDADGYEQAHPNAFGWNAPRTSSSSSKRKAATARIAKIPFALSHWIARAHLPVTLEPRP